MLGLILLTNVNYWYKIEKINYTFKVNLREKNSRYSIISRTFRYVSLEATSADSMRVTGSLEPSNGFPPDIRLDRTLLLFPYFFFTNVPIGRILGRSRT